MHIFRRAMPLWRERREDEVAGAGGVGRGGLASDSLARGGEQKKARLAPRARFGGEGELQTFALASRLEHGLNFDQLGPCRTPCA